MKENIEDIITCDAVSLFHWKDRFDKITLLHKSPDAIKGFYKKIITILNYSDLRSGNGNLLFNFYSYLGVNVCVYCNSQHVILLSESKKARLQADHNLPKSDYPYLSVSLSNLYPTCNNCNHAKSDDDVNYFLYYTDKPNSQLRFRIPDKEVAEFFANKRNEEALVVIFDQGDSKLNDVLNIDQIYANHKDYAADFFRKHKIYSDSYISSLSFSFEKIFGKNTDQLKRLIFGTTLKEKDINKRVSSKLYIDLKEQLDRLME